MYGGHITMDLYAIRKELSVGKPIYDIPLRVTFYARVSTDKDEQMHSLSAQIRYYDTMIRQDMLEGHSSRIRIHSDIHHKFICLSKNKC